MSKTKIEWADRVWNPVTGCTKVSEGCRNCYAEGIAKRFWGERKFGDVRCLPWRLEYPLRWKKPGRVFVNSVSDLFHEDVPFNFVAAVFGIMASSPSHTYLILTKRPDRMASFFQWIKKGGKRACRVNHYPKEDIKFAILSGIRTEAMKQVTFGGPIRSIGIGLGSWPLSNVWLGVSVEDQKTADERIPLLLKAPAAVRFVSCEPMLGPVDLNSRECLIDKRRFKLTIGNCLDWVICGGESGHGARPLHPDWVRSLRDQCKETGTPFFFKQWGEWLPGVRETGELIHWQDGSLGGSSLKLGPTKSHTWKSKNGTWSKFCASKVGKKMAGNILDNERWDQFPRETQKEGTA